MKVTTLTSTQQSEAATLKASLVSAQTAYSVALKAFNTYLKAASGALKNQRAHLTDDGTTVVLE